MPIKQSAKKYMRVTARKTEINKKIKGIYRNAIKKTREAIASKEVSEAQEWLKKSIKSLDKATQKGVIKKNTASRTKSRLNRSVKEIAKSVKEITKSVKKAGKSVKEAAIKKTKK